jgi:N-acetylmuramoyl-L-alanine amidase
MRPVFAAIVAAMVVALCMATAASADTFVVGGYSFPSPVPFQVLADKNEVCAPGIPALRRLGVEVAVSADSVAMKAPTGASVIVRIGSTRAKVNDVQRDLPKAPSGRGDGILLPIRAIAWHLGLACRWDEKSRTVFLHPKISGITFARLPDKVRVKIAGTGQLSYSAGVLKDPFRIYIDVSNADLFAAEQQIAINEGDLISVRASQHSLNPDLVRVVLDLKQEPAQYFPSAADGGRSIVVDLPAPPLGLPAGGGIATIRSIRLERRSDSVCRLVVDAVATPVASLTSVPGSAEVEIKLSNARLAVDKVEGESPLVTSAEVEPTGENQACIRLGLRRGTPVALVRRARGFAVLIGGVSLSDMTIVLDPGHGGRQPGAIGPSGLEEKTINLAVALRAQKLLQAEGARVLLTRESDCSLIPVSSRDELRRELCLRAGLANKLAADVFVAIHCNASPGGVRRIGTETYYCTPRSLSFAKSMQQELVTGLELSDGGVHQANFVVVRTAQMPAVLVELAYLNNAREEALLGSPEFRERAAMAVVNGVRRFAADGGLLDYYAELESSGIRQAVRESTDADETKPGAAGGSDDQPAGDGQ